MPEPTKSQAHVLVGPINVNLHFLSFPTYPQTWTPQDNGDLTPANYWNQASRGPCKIDLRPPAVAVDSHASPGRAEGKQRETSHLKTWDSIGIWVLTSWLFAVLVTLSVPRCAGSTCITVVIHAFSNSKLCFFDPVVYNYLHGNFTTFTMFLV